MTFCLLLGSVTGYQESQDQAVSWENGSVCSIVECGYGIREWQITRRPSPLHIYIRIPATSHPLFEYPCRSLPPLAKNQFCDHTTYATFPSHRRRFKTWISWYLVCAVSASSASEPCAPCQCLNTLNLG